ncbi:fumarate reductase subunit D [Wenzhouxiangella sp. 15190]|nr:fumarate reductase subunit D [Wenzhouxiangella sp. 15190]
MVWLPFAAGGTVAAFLLPAVMLAVLLVTLGVLPADALSHDRIQAFVDHPVGKLAILVVLALPLWHAAHRLRMTLQDLGVRRPGTRRLVARLCYGLATVITVALLYGLLPTA